MNVGIDVVLCHTCIHILLIQPDSLNLVKGIFKGRYLAVGVEIDVLPTGNKPAFLYQLELFHASFCRSLCGNFLKGDRHVESCLGM